MATAEPSEKPSTDEQHTGDSGDTVVPADTHMSEAGEELPLNEQYGYKDEAKAEAVVAAATTGADALTKSSTAHLDGLSFEELKSLLSEKRKRRGELESLQGPRGAH
ncbi:hypothetical protein NXY56_007151 [Leishmania guyanensis]|uniref:Uncharacterized protein n=1 Tax=Leishmania guyanensis TaxID=5670 RepID=A0A1E1IZ75_LEIGU|nr:hypothetical protein, conserved [Leishmania guyanensis]